LSGGTFAQPVCGDTITEDTTLTSDLLECVGDGLVIGASGITLDCSGFSISGISPDADNGVYIQDRQNITVRNCDINGFYDGIYYTAGSTDSNIFDNNFYNSVNSGIYLYNNSDRAKIQNNKFENNIVGIHIRETADSNAIDNNFFNNDYSIIFSLGARNNYFLRNTIKSSNGGSLGIYSDSTTISSENNIFQDGNISTAGTDIYLTADTNLVLIGTPYKNSAFDAITSLLFVKWWINTTVLDSNSGTPLNEADLNIFNAKGIKQYQGKTDAQGKFESIVYDYNENSAGKQDYPNPYDVNVYFVGYNTNGITIDVDSNAIIVIRMGGAGGEPPIYSFDFTISMPATCSVNKGCLGAGCSTCTRCWAEPTDSIIPIDGNIACQGQDNTTPFLVIDFTGSASTFDLNMFLEETPPANLYLRVNSNNALATSTRLTNASQIIIADQTPTGTQDANIWVWGEFEAYYPDDLNVSGTTDLNTGEFN